MKPVSKGFYYWTTSDAAAFVSRLLQNDLGSMYTWHDAVVRVTVKDDQAAARVDALARLNLCKEGIWETKER